MIGAIKSANRQESKQATSVPASLFIRSEVMGIESLPFDLFISESHALKFKISDHPLQNGAVKSDHIIKQLRTCTVRGMFTNHPMNSSVSLEEGDTIEVQEGSELRQMTENLSLKNYERLEALALKEEPVRLVTSLVVYPQMLIQSITADRNPESGESVEFTMVLREFETVTLKQVSQSYIYNPESTITTNERLISTKKNKGRQSAEEAAADEIFARLEVEVFE